MVRLAKEWLESTDSTTQAMASVLCEAGKNKDFSTIEEIQAYLKTKGLGTFNLSLDFHYYKDEEKHG